MKKINLAIVGIMGVAAFSSAYAQDQSNTFSIGYTHVDVKKNNSIAGIDGDIGSLTFRYAYDPTKNVGIEFEASRGIRDVDFRSRFASGDVKLNYNVATFVALRLPIENTKSQIFVRGGYHKTQFKAKASGSGASSSVTASADGFAFGVGGRYFFDDKNGIRADYTRFNGDGSGVNTFSITYERAFGG